MFLLHLSVVWTHAVDVPYWDEWSYLDPARAPLDGPLSWEFLFGRHNEHRIVLARLQTWLLYRLDGWDLVTQQLLNFVVYGLGLAWFAWACARRIPELPGWLALGGALLLLSGLGWENFLWGFQASTHHAVFGFLLTAWLLGQEAPSPRRLALATLGGALTVCSQAAGAAAIGGLALAWAAWKLDRARGLEGAARRRELLEGGAVALALGLALALWAWGLGRVEGPARVWPWTASFWRYFVNLAGLGFGFRSRSWALGLLSLGLVVVPLVGLRLRGPLAPRDWTLVAWASGLLAVVATIALGRAGLDPTARLAKSSRYAAFVEPLVLVSLAAWAAWLRHGLPAALARWGARGRWGLLLAVWGVACLGHADDWRLKRYREVYATRSAARAALRVHGEGPLRGPLHPLDLRSRVAEARRLGLSFTR